MQFQIDLEQEEDGRWIAEVLDLPGVLAYRTTQKEALAAVQTLARCVYAASIPRVAPQTQRRLFGSCCSK